MEIKKPVAATVLLAFVAHTADQIAGAKLFIDAPPGAVVSAAVSSTSAQAVNYVFYNMTTDERIEAPVIEKIETEQS
jgi:hypothetical protein